MRNVEVTVSPRKQCVCCSAMHEEALPCLLLSLMSRRLPCCHVCHVCPWLRDHPATEFVTAQLSIILHLYVLTFMRARRMLQDHAAKNWHGRYLMLSQQGFLLWRAPQHMLRTHRSLEAYCATLWWRWLVFFSFFHVMEHRLGWNLTGENRSTRGKPCPSATLFTINPIWTDPGSNLGLRGGRPATNRLSRGTALTGVLLKIQGFWDVTSSRRQTVTDVT
jgi:hypothetical protein